MANVIYINSIISIMVRGISASSLSANPQGPAIKSMVENIAQNIDANIISAHSNGANYVVVELPNTFDTTGSGLTLADIQTIIYSDIITLYGTSESEGGRGFDVKLHSKNKCMFIIVKWTPNFDDEERRARTEIIKKHMSVSSK